MRSFPRLHNLPRPRRPHVLLERRKAKARPALEPPPKTSTIPSLPRTLTTASVVVATITANTDPSLVHPGKPQNHLLTHLRTHLPAVTPQSTPQVVVLEETRLLPLPNLLLRHLPDNPVSNHPVDLPATLVMMMMILMMSLATLSHVVVVADVVTARDAQDALVPVPDPLLVATSEQKISRH